MTDKELFKCCFITSENISFYDYIFSIILFAAIPLSMNVLVGTGKLKLQLIGTIQANQTL